MRVAEKLGMSVSEAMCKVSATEFVDWQTLIEMEFNEPSRTDFYIIQLTYYVYLLQFMLGGEPKMKPEEFKIKFDFDAAREKVLAGLHEPTEEELEELQQKRFEAEKRWWGAQMRAAGADKTGKNEKVVKVIPGKDGKPVRIP